MTTPRTTLITGYPSSFIARRLLAKVLASEPGGTVVCPVADNFMELATAQLKRDVPEPSRSRVKLFAGDVTAMDLGLPGKRFLELASTVHVIHHCPTAIHPGVERRVAERVNVGGAGEVLELAEAGSAVESVVHWSSAAVSGKREGRVLESELVRPHRGFRSVIEETLFRAERVMRESMDHLPITVLRPALTVGDSRTGEIDRLEGPYLLILLMLSSPIDLRMPLPGRGDVALNLVPVDFVVNAGYHIAQDPASHGRTVHLVDRQPLSARRVFELIAEETGRPGPVGSLPTQVATALLRTPGLERFSHIPRTFLEQLATSVVYDDRNAHELLAGSGIRCPPAASYLKVMVEHVRREQQARAEAGRRRAADTDSAGPRPFEDAEDPLE